MHYAVQVGNQEALTQLSDQVARLQKERQRPKNQTKFHSALEQEYLSARNRHFLEIERPMLIGGVLFYLLFAWSDLALGGDRGWFILSARVILGSLLLAALFLLPREYLKQHMFGIASLGLLLVGFSLLLFIPLIPSEMRFAYHLGMIPLQVFTLVALRQSTQAVLWVSSLLYGGYLLLLALTPQLTERSEINQIVVIFLPMFLVFWLLLLCLSVYLAHGMEKIWRNDFLQNKLLDLEAKRLTLLSQELQALSTTDALTGLANRRYFEQQVQIEWRRALRYQYPLALIIVDVDFFKDYNDHYGHQAGDECLKRIAEVLAQHSQRSGELCARIGGEEFVLVITRTQAAEVMQLANAACAAVAALAIPHVRSQSGFCTVSMGVAVQTPSSEEGALDLLGAADRCLYQAKKQGRNQAVLCANV